MIMRPAMAHPTPTPILAPCDNPLLLLGSFDVGVGVGVTGAGLADTMDDVLEVGAAVVDAVVVAVTVKKTARSAGAAALKVSSEGLVLQRRAPFESTPQQCHMFCAASYLMSGSP